MHRCDKVQVVSDHRLCIPAEIVLPKHRRAFCVRFALRHCLMPIPPLQKKRVLKPALVHTIEKFLAPGGILFMQGDILEVRAPWESDARNALVGVC
jgi:hypothetical protein